MLFPQYYLNGIYQNFMFPDAFTFGNRLKFDKFKPADAMNHEVSCTAEVDEDCTSKLYSLALYAKAEKRPSAVTGDYSEGGTEKSIDKVKRSKQESEKLVTILSPQSYEEYGYNPYHNVAFTRFFNSAELSLKEITVLNLFNISETFLRKAHEIVLESSANFSGEYFKMIKLSVKALLLLTKKYGKCLDPYLELIVYYKLANIYLKETENIDLAERHINRAIAIASRNNLLYIKFISEFLAAQVILKLKPELTLKYIEERILNFDKLSIHSIACVFKLFKIQLLMTIDSDRAMSSLQPLIHDSSLDDTSKLISIILQTNLCVSRHLIDDAKRYSRQAKDFIEDTNFSYPRQIYAMYYLSQLSFSIQNEVKDDAEKVIRQISNYILYELGNGWKDWNEDGTFKVIFQPARENSHTANFSYTVSWFNSDEFVIVFYIMRGVFHINDNSKFTKAKKILEKCLCIIDGQLDQLTYKTKSKRKFSLKQLSNRISRLRFFRYYANFYFAWIGYLNHDFSAMDAFEEFVNHYERNHLAYKEQVSDYDILVPKTLYLLGLLAHSKGQYCKAKEFFLEIRHFTESKTLAHNDLALTSFKFLLGNGAFNELYLFSSFHLWIIAEFDIASIRELSVKDEGYIDNLNVAYKFRREVYDDLVNAVLEQTQDSARPHRTSDVVQITFHVYLRCFSENYLRDLKGFLGSSDPHSIGLNLLEAAETNLATRNPYVACLVYYFFALIQGDKYNNKIGILEKSLKVLENDHLSNNEKLLKYYFLRECFQELQQLGDNDKADLIQAQMITIRAFLEQR